MGMLIDIEVKDFNGRLYRRLDSYYLRPIAEGIANILRQEGHLVKITRRSFIPGSRSFDVWVRYVHADSEYKEVRV